MHSLQEDHWEKNGLKGTLLLTSCLLVLAASWPDTARAYVPHRWCAVGFHVHFSGHATTSALGCCTNPAPCPSSNILSVRLIEVWEGQTSHIPLPYHQSPGFSWAIPWAVWPFIPHTKSQLPPAETVGILLPGWHVAFKASSALPSDQASFRGQSVGLTPSGLFGLSDLARRRYGATCASSPLIFPQTMYCLVWWESTQYSHGPVHLPPLQNCFQAFVVGLNTEGQNLFLLHYLV